MGRRNRILAPLLVLACAGSTAWANKKAFNINDDLLAFPQFQVLFPDEYILDSHAKDLLQTQAISNEHAQQQPVSEQKSTQVYSEDRPSEPHTPRESTPELTYEEMILEDRRFFCQIPRVETSENSQTNGSAQTSEADEKRELARATDRGIELLREMEGKCMYYVSGWWSYSFCYKKQVKQFHALPSGSGIPNYPPMEDPSTLSFILGRFPDADHDEDDYAEPERRKSSSSSSTDMAELQTKGGSRYLVQHLRGGDRCDLTGRDRKIEVQFHCHPQSTDRIGWIKELTTCSYLMVIYTPRLCNDVAFQPPQQDEVHSIECREILSPEQVPEWEAVRDYHLAHQLVDAAAAATPEFAVIGDIEVGAQRLVGAEGKEIEKGRVASAWEEKVDVVAKRENGEVQSLSRDELEKFDLDPKKIEDLRKRLEELAQGKDWTLEMVTANGERGLRGIVTTDDDSDEEDGHEDSEKDDGHDDDGTAPSQPQETDKANGENGGSEAAQTEEGSEEVFKDEL
ncbi:glucosidase II beta subunit-like protein-domain-containing protein [Aspergillus ambiguus]|uniref:PRKCSH domain-containing protein n=1 Tax=Aspergillus ambiguus TaxID=176160 RepID=UPI003CCD5E69